MPPGLSGDERGDLREQGVASPGEQSETVAAIVETIRGLVAATDLEAAARYVERHPLLCRLEVISLLVSRAESAEEKGNAELAARLRTRIGLLVGSDDLDHHQRLAELPRLSHSLLSDAPVEKHLVAVVGLVDQLSIDLGAGVYAPAIRPRIWDGLTAMSASVHQLTGDGRWSRKALEIARTAVERSSEAGDEQADRVVEHCDVARRVAGSADDL